MTQIPSNGQLRIDLDTKNCELSAGQIRKLEQGLGPLRRPVEHFPVRDLHITIYWHARNHVFQVKTALVLPKRTLVSGDIDPLMYTAFERCVRKLMAKVEDYKGSLGAEPQLAKHVEGTYQELLPTQIPDVEGLEQAVESGDYAAFRQATFAYEEPIRKRIGRWIHRYPKLEQELQRSLDLEDLVEEVFLNGFERYGDRPRDVRFGQWLESLIDPSVKLLMAHPEDELANISFARSLQGVPPRQD